MRHDVVAAGTAAALLLLAACGDAADPPATSEDAATVACGGSEYARSALADAPPASSLPDGPADAVDDVGEPAFDPSEDWRVVHQSDDRVDLVRELEEPIDQGGGDVRTHEARAVELITGSTNVPDGTWMLTSSSPCTQRLVTDGDLADADLALADDPSPDTTTLDLLVHERACASGRSAEGRIELLELDETADEVRLRIGVQRLDGDQTCEGNPPTPYTVELAEPVGERDVVDSSVVPARPLTTDEPGAGPQ